MLTRALLICCLGITACANRPPAVRPAPEPAPVAQAQPAPATPSNDRAYQEALERARELRGKLSQDPPVLYDGATSMESFSATVSSDLHRRAAEETELEREFQRAIHLAPDAAARALAQREAAEAQAGLANRIATTEQSITAPGKEWDWVRSLLLREYVQPKRKKAQRLVDDCRRAGGECEALPARFDAPTQPALPPPQGPCSLQGRLAHAELFAAANAKKPFATLDYRGAQAVVSLPHRRGERARAQLRGFEAPLWVNPTAALTTKVELVPGHAWLAPGARVNAYAASPDGTAQVEQDFTPGTRPARYQGKLPCSDLRPAGYFPAQEQPEAVGRREAGGLGMGNVESWLQVKGRKLALRASPSGRVVATAVAPARPDYRFKVKHVEGKAPWIRVRGHAGFEFDGWVSSSTVEKASAGGGGTGMSLGWLGPGSGASRLAQTSLPLRLSDDPGSPVVAVLAPGASFRVLAEDAQTVWISMEGIQPLNERGLFAVRRTELLGAR